MPDVRMTGTCDYCHASGPIRSIVHRGGQRHGESHSACRDVAACADRIARRHAAADRVKTLRDPGPVDPGAFGTAGNTGCRTYR